MESSPENLLKSLSNVVSSVNSIFYYDSQLIFSDSFERIKQQLNNFEKLIALSTNDPSNYWVVYNITLAIIPISEQIIFAGYSDQILDFLLSLNNTISSILIFCTSRYIPFRLQVFLTVCSAFANTEDAREKDADLFIKTYKNELLQLKQLEELNINGLTESVTLCNKKKCPLSTLFDTALMAIELMSVHFNTSEEIVFEKIGSPRKSAKKPKARPVKEEQAPQAFPLPPPHTINLVCNAFNSPLSKNDYISKYSQVIQAWTNPECQLAPSFLHRLIYSFLKAGNYLDGVESLEDILPDDKIVQLATAISSEQWLDASEIIQKLSKDEIKVDFQFYDEIAFKIWKRFCTGKITDPMALKGVLHILVLSPSPFPMQTSMVALHYCWHLHTKELFLEASQASEAALNVLEDFRDIFTIRTFNRPLPSTTKIPNKPLDQGYMAFEKWIDCLHTDLLTVWIKSKLKYGLQIEIEKAKEKFAQDIENTKIECQKTKQLYGTLSIKQKEMFDNLINRQFKPPIHSPETEKQLIEYFKNNNAALALLYTQMAFFRPQKADILLEKACKCMSSEINARNQPKKLPILYVNKTEAGLYYPYSTPEAKSVAAFGKEAVGSIGLTPSNISLYGTGVKQELTDPFVISKLKPNTLYSFGFGAYDSTNELIDNITEPFTLTTCHKLSVELIYSYMASAAYHLKNVSTFDISLEYLLKRFTCVVKIPDDHSFYQHLNPFNKFYIKSSTFSEPAPMLRSFSTALIMAARLFSNKPLHATSFQKVALILSQVLHNYDLTLQICHEMFASIQPLLFNAYHSKWVIHPLLYIINALKNNKETSKSELHQQLAAKCSYSFNSILIQLYHEKQLSSYSLNSVIELQPNPSRSAFMLFASKNQILEANVNDPTLPLAAAEMFRTSPEKSYDDLFSKFKADPQFPSSAVFLVLAALNIGYCPQAITWCNAALEYIKSTLHEPDEKQQQKRSNNRSNSKTQQRKKVSTTRGKKNEPSKLPEDDAAENSAATKIQNVWNRYYQRRANIAKFDAVNKYRAVLNLLLAMCMIECDQHLISTTSQETVRTGRREKHLAKGRISKHSNAKRPGPSEEDQTSNDQSGIIISALVRAIVIGNRSNQSSVIKSAATFFKIFLSTILPGTAQFNSLSPLATSITAVVIRNIPLSERYAQDLFKELLFVMSNDNQVPNITINLIDACQISQNSGQLIWLIPDQNDLPQELIEVQNNLKKRDPSENQFYEADAIYQRAIRPEIFPNEPANRSNETFSNVINEMAIALQHKQKLSMSICLQSRMAFTFFDRKNNQLALSRLFDALECHFRLVKAQDKVDQILKGETEESFYQKHSWAGCVSIFVISSLISIFSDRTRSMQLSRLASFSLSSLFTASPLNPKKQIDYADYEPSEIIPGIDIFSEFDPQNPLLEVPLAPYLSIAISNLLSSMLSYEMYFEMFKPLSFARHFFRFISREKRDLARARLITIITCTKFGLLHPAMKILNDVLTNFGEPRISKETVLYPPNSKLIQFDIHESPNSSINTEAAKAIATPAMVAQIANLYGSSISCHYAICVSKILQNIANSSDPSGSIVDLTARQASQTARGKHKRQHHGKKELETSQNTLTVQSVDSFDGSLTLAEALINDTLSKEFKPGQENIKHELELEKAQIYLKQWKWEDAIDIAQSVIKSNPTSPPLLSGYIDRPMLLVNGLISTSAQIISQASYQLHDYQNAEKVATPYMKALLLIHKADYEGAAQLLSKIALHPPITAFHREYVLSVAQLVELFCFNHKLYDSLQSTLISPIDLITNIDNETYSFFTEQLGMNEGKSFFIQDVHLLIRLKHLKALTIVHFNGMQNPVDILTDAQNLMEEKCPYIGHGLSFLLNSSLSRIQMQSILSANPLLIQNWNQEVFPLLPKPGSNISISPELIEKITFILQTMFSQAPDCVVHPASQQCVLDYAVLAGVSSNEPGKKLEQSISALLIASVVRSSRRYIQSLIAQSSNSAPAQTCSILLLNENKDQNLRNIAAAYYAHVCSLDLPIFDTEILEMRTLLYFKCFEDLCTPFKTLQRASEQVLLESGCIVGQWYQVDSKIFKSSKPSDNGGKSTYMGGDRSTVTSRLRTPSGSGTRTYNSTISSRASTAYSTKRKATGNNPNAGQLKGSFYFFIGIIVDVDDSANKKKTVKNGKEVKEKDNKENSLSLSVTASSIINEGTGRLIPVIIIAQANDLRSTSNEMAEISLSLDEAARLESSEAQGEAPPQRDDKDSADSKKKKTRISKTKAAQNSDASQNVSLLKNQANIAFKNAEMKWNIAIHKAEAIFNKSNRITAILADQKNQWPIEYKLDGIDVNNANMFSHFFNTQYGVNEKAPQFADWLCQSYLNLPARSATSSATPRSQSLVK